MRLKSRLIQFASAGLLVAFAASDALAQGTTSGGAAGSANQGVSKGATTQPQSGAGAAGAGKASGAEGPAASQGPWTANNVTAARPFGDINIQAAGTTNESVRTWAQARTPSERAELSGRCDVITDPANSARYPMNAQAFCRTFEMVASASPTGAPAANPSAAPGAAKSGQPGQTTTK